MCVWYSTHLGYNVLTKQIVCDVDPYSLTLFNFLPYVIYGPYLPRCSLDKKSMLCATLLYLSTLFTIMTLDSLCITFATLIKSSEALFTVLFLSIYNRECVVDAYMFSFTMVVSISFIVKSSEFSQRGLVLGCLSNACNQLKNLVNKDLMDKKEDPMFRQHVSLSAMAFLISVPFCIFNGITCGSLALQSIDSLLFCTYQCASMYVLSEVSPFQHSILNTLKRVVGICGALVYEYHDTPFDANDAYGIFGVLASAAFFTKIPVKHLFFMSLLFPAFMLSLRAHDGNADRPSSECLRLYRFVPYGHNIGDEAGIDIASAVSHCKNMNHGKLLLGLGSTMHHSPHDSVVVWGTGAMYYQSKRKNLDVHALRGPLTAEKLDIVSSKNLTYGDPGLLMPHLMPSVHRRCHPSQPTCVILHHNDLHLRKTLNITNSLFISALSPDYAQVYQTIADCGFVLSSSLHGIVFAEALGVPTRWLQISKSLTEKTEGKFKYCDYYGGSRNDLQGALQCLKGRGPYKAATSVENGLRMGGVDPLTYDTLKLIDAFPHDMTKGCPTLPGCSPLDREQKVGMRRACV